MQHPDVSVAEANSFAGEQPVKADAIKVLDANESSAEDGQAKPRIQSAVRTISILLAVADSPNGLKAKEIMEKLGLSRQVTYHLIHTMHGTGHHQEERQQPVRARPGDGFYRRRVSAGNWLRLSILLAGFDRLSPRPEKPPTQVAGWMAKSLPSPPRAANLR